MTRRARIAAVTMVAALLLPIGALPAGGGEPTMRHYNFNSLYVRAGSVELPDEGLDGETATTYSFGGYVDSNGENSADVNADHFVYIADWGWEWTGTTFVTVEGGARIDPSLRSASLALHDVEWRARTPDGPEEGTPTGVIADIDVTLVATGSRYPTRETSTSWWTFGRSQSVQSERVRSVTGGAVVDGDEIALAEWSTILHRRLTIADHIERSNNNRLDRANVPGSPQAADEVIQLFAMNESNWLRVDSTDSGWSITWNDQEFAFAPDEIDLTIAPDSSTVSLRVDLPAPTSATLEALWSADGEVIDRTWFARFVVPDYREKVWAASTFVGMTVAVSVGGESWSGAGQLAVFTIRSM